MDACKLLSICSYLSNEISSKIYSQISLSDNIFRARNTTNNGIGCFMRGICKQMGNPNPLFLELIIILICFGEIHLKSGTDFISAFHVYLVSFFDIL